MHRSTSLTLTAAALALATAWPALAADYDPPILLEDAPSYVPVEVGSSWYLRGDVSYNANSPVYDVDGAANLRFGGGLGVGYQFKDL
jgi:opacity protein-like surface antigen